MSVASVDGNHNQSGTSSSSTPPRTIDINADLGEGFPWDEPLLQRVSSASICCGAHASDPETINRTLALAWERGVAVGAHPGFADRANFGRKDQKVTQVEAELIVRTQVAELAIMAGRSGHVLQFIKPHGSLYNQAQSNRAIAAGVVESVLRMGLPVVGLPGSCVHQLARAAGMRFVAEGFLDRRYRADGTLVPRSEPDAFITDHHEMEDQLLRMIDQGIESICIHGDVPEAVAQADLARTIIDRVGLLVRSFVASPVRTTPLGRA